MRPVDYSARRYAAAKALLRVITRERPDDIRQLVKRGKAALGFEVGSTTFNDATLEVISTWCRDLNLVCDAVQDEALLVVITGGQNLKERTGADEEDDEHRYYLPVIPGESLTKFKLRAEREFYRLHSGATPASDEINLNHIEWLFRFQVEETEFGPIAKSANTDWRDVKRAIRSVADLLELKLRKTIPGRPRGKRSPKRPSHHIVRRSSRR